MLRKLIREPLLHFLMLGAVIFGAHRMVSNNSSSKPDEIVITQGKIENLVSSFGGMWQRHPTDEELQGLIRDYVREEVAYREARNMGLDHDDTIIRRRLQQKLEFVSHDLATQLQPSDEDLTAYLLAHREAYQIEPTLSFRHVYLNPEKRNSQLQEDAKKILAQLQENPDRLHPGDPIMLEPEFALVTQSDVGRIFGDSFAIKLASLQPGRWLGPVDSGYGAHLVFVTDHQGGHLPSLDQVRERIRRDWENEKRVEANEKFYQALLQRYRIRIEQPEEKKLAEMR